MDLETAKKIMGKNFIGQDELKRISGQFKIAVENKIPKIPFSAHLLQKIKKDYILILGAKKFLNGKKLTLNNLRECFGIDPTVHEPCFYNQDWYLKQKFANNRTLENKWYLIRKAVVPVSRGLAPFVIEEKLSVGVKFPSAILTAFTFFTFYFLHGLILWKNDFVWCSDRDNNGDRIYTGRYCDSKKINKNGFNVHRYLSIRNCYGAAFQLNIK